MASCLITGAAGFVGSHLAHALSSSGWTVDGVDEREFFTSRSHLPRTPFRSMFDLRDTDTFLEPSPDPRWDVVFHIGAVTDTTCSDEALLEERNVRYSQTLWDYCSRTRTPLVYASSAATYGNGEHGYVDQHVDLEKLKPLNLYGWSKHRFDLWAVDQARRGVAPPAWSGFKFFNVYGSAEQHKGPMASFVHQALHQAIHSQSVRLFKSLRPGIADGAQARDFVSVWDVTDVLRFAGTHSGFESGIYNLGTGQARSYNDLVGAVFRALGKPSRIDYFDPPPSIESRYQYFTQAPMDKLRRQGYLKPFRSLEEGILECTRFL